MIVGEVIKGAYEHLARGIDFSARIAAGETVTLVSVTVTNLITGVDVTATLIESAPGPVLVGNTVSFIIKGGVAGQTYLISAKITTSGGEYLEDHLQVSVS